MKYARLYPGPGFRPINALLFFSQRLISPLPLRRSVIRVIGQVIDWLHGGKNAVGKPVAEHQRILAALRRDGFAPMGVLLDKNQCKDIHDFMRDKLLNDRDKCRDGFVSNNGPAGVRLGDYGLRDVINCPHVLELANSPLLIDMARSYIGCKPTISNIGVRWSAPEPEGTSVLQAYHRDCEDWRYFKVLIYLTDVDETGGPHVFVRGTHLTRAPVRLAYQNDQDVIGKYGHEKLMMALGKQGESFAVDTSGVHKGAAPTGTTRMMLQLQYSLLPCFAYTYEPAVCDLGLELDPYINRLIVKQPGLDAKVHNPIQGGTVPISKSLTAEL